MATFKGNSSLSRKLCRVLWQKCDREGGSPLCPIKSCCLSCLRWCQIAKTRDRQLGIVARSWVGSTSGKSAATVGDNWHSCTTGVSLKMNGRHSRLPGFVWTQPNTPVCLQFRVARKQWGDQQMAACLHFTVNTSELQICESTHLIFRISETGGLYQILWCTLCVLKKETWYGRAGKKTPGKISVCFWCIFSPSSKTYRVYKVLNFQVWTKALRPLIILMYYLSVNENKSLALNLLCPAWT